MDSNWINEAVADLAKTATKAKKEMQSMRDSVTDSINVEITGKLKSTVDKLQNVKIEEENAMVLHGKLSGIINEMVLQEYVIININQFYNRITEKHMAYIFYYE